MHREDHFVVLSCSHDGRVVDVRRCDVDIAPESGQSIAELVDPASADKARQFLKRLEGRGHAYDWELNLPLGGTPVCFHFAGRRVGDELWIMAARNRRGLLELLDRGRERDAVGAGRVPTDGAGAGVEYDDFAYEELTRVNNEMANLHRDVAKQASELEKLNRRKNQLLGMAAHDLRNPVAAIHAYSELLETDLSPSLDPERLEFLTTIKSTSKFLLDLVNDLLDFATIEAGELRLRLERKDLVSLVRANVGLNRILAAKNEIDVRFASEVDRAEVEVDARKLQQVVDNLLANAVKFSPRRSVIDVRVRRDDRNLVVSVSDQGRGIASDEKEGLFLPFRRGNAIPAHAEPGSGLGLAICRRIVEGHGGRIWVEDGAEPGAVFCFSIPAPR